MIPYYVKRAQLVYD